MPKHNRAVPSLNALRTFECAARLLSFTAAATQLHVSQAAVSRQVRALEGALGRPLFQRLHRRVELNAAGRALASELARAFDAIDRAVVNAGAGGARVLKISVEPAFAARWLAPRLPGFVSAHEDIELEIDSSPLLRELGGEADVAIRYLEQGRRQRGRHAEKLVAVHGFPVIAPSLLRRCGPLKSPKSLLQLTLLREDDGHYWREWFVAAGVGPVAIRRHLGLSDQALVLQAAIDGQGVALGDELMAGEDLRSGRLVRLFDAEARYGAYWLLRSPGRNGRAAQRTFCDWLRRELRAYQAPLRGPAP